MINYNRLHYEIKGDLTNFSTNISESLKCPLPERGYQTQKDDRTAVQKLKFL